MKFALTAIFSVLAAQAALAAEVPVLAELFTSEGCSSCPPADAVLMQLDQRQPVAGAHIIVLSEHVDYWNSLGWRDPFSSPLFTRRQSDYAHLLEAEVYTPQIVIDGRVQLNGSDARDIQAAVAKAAAKPKVPVEIVQATREGGDAVVHVSIPPLPSGKSDVWVAVADESDQSSVAKGENAGRRLAHVAVVRSLTKAGSVSKSAGFDRTLRLPLAAANPGASRVVVWVAQPLSAVTGAAMAPLAAGSLAP